MLKGHENKINSVIFSPEGKYLASASSDNTIKLWNVEDKSEVATLKGHSKSVTSVIFSPDGKRLISSSQDYTIKLWSTESY